MESSLLGPQSRINTKRNRIKYAHKAKALFRKKYRIKNRKHRERLVSYFSSAAIDDLSRSATGGKIDFIKMDIEGAELHALRGAKETIKRYKPTLAVCVYHSLRDFTELPLYIKSINPNYKLYLSHNSLQAGETILFATEKDLVPIPV